MNIWLKEMKDSRKSLIIWSLAIVGFMVSAMSKYQGYARSDTSINDLISSLPAGVSAALGFKGLDLQSAGGFYAMCAIYLGVMLGVHAVLLGSGIIAKEETDRTIEFLGTKPVSRSRILYSKLLAAFTAIAFLNLVTLVVSIVTVAAFNEGPSINRDILFLMPSIFFIQLWFLAIGAAFAATLRWPKRAVASAAAALLVAFILSVFADLTDRFGFLKYATPFKYFDAKTIFAEDRYSSAYIAIATAAIAALLLLSRYAYRRRDLRL